MYKKIINVRPSDEVDYERIPLGSGGYLSLRRSCTKGNVYYYATFGYQLSDHLIENGETGFKLPKMRVMVANTYRNIDAVPQVILDDMNLAHLKGIGGDENSDRKVFPEFYGRTYDPNVSVTIYMLRSY